MTENEPEVNAGDKNPKKKGIQRHKLDEQEKAWLKYAITVFVVFISLFVGQIFVYIIVGAYSDWLYALTITIILVMPGYLANAGMVVVGGGKPLDGGRVCKDGRRLFGKGKTIRGFFGGPLLFGVPIALAIHGILYLCWPGLETQIEAWFSTPGLYIIFDTPPDKAVEYFKLYLIGGAYPMTPASLGYLILRITAVSFGTAVGDLVGSFMKRRMDRKRGEPIWILDQIDFAVFVLLFALPFVPWNFDFLLLVIFTMIWTPSVTLIANWFSYSLGMKDVPW